MPSFTAYVFKCPWVTLNPLTAPFCCAWIDSVNTVGVLHNSVCGQCMNVVWNVTFNVAALWVEDHSLFITLYDAYKRRLWSEENDTYMTSKAQGGVSLTRCETLTVTDSKMKSSATKLVMSMLVLLCQLGLIWNIHLEPSQYMQLI